MGKSEIGMLIVLGFMVGVLIGFVIDNNSSLYSKNEVVMAGNQGLGIVKKFVSTKLYTIVLIDSNGNTKNETKMVSEDIKQYRIGQ